MKALDIESDVLLKVYLPRKYKDKLNEHARENDHTNMAKCKSNEYAKLRKELDGVGNKSKVISKICRHTLY